MRGKLREIDDRWQREYGDNAFDPARFPDPGAMVRERPPFTIVLCMISPLTQSAIRVDEPGKHFVKMGTPTMGGILIIGATIVPTLLFLLLGGVAGWVVADRRDNSRKGVFLRLQVWDAQAPIIDQQEITIQILQIPKECSGCGWVSVGMGV